MKFEDVKGEAMSLDRRLQVSQGQRAGTLSVKTLEGVLSWIDDETKQVG